MGNLITIKNKTIDYRIPEGKPLIVVWRGKNKERKGISTAIGWLKQGERPHTVTLIHSCFQTLDKVEQEYLAKWTIYTSQIVSIRPLSSHL